MRAESRPDPSSVGHRMLSHKVQGRAMNGRHFKSIWVGLLGLILGANANGATQAEIQAAVDSGVAWLVSQQQANGSWPGSRSTGLTALSLAVLGHHAQELNTTPLTAGYIYRSQYEAGMNNLLALAFHDAANERVWFGNSNPAFAENYFSGPAMMAIVLSGEPDRVVDQPGIAVHGLTYRQIVQRILNSIDNAQLTAGNSIGSWDYRPSGAAGDLSVSGWMTLGLGYARDRFEIELPADMMDRISASIDIMQQTANPGSVNFGGAGYRSSNNPAYSVWVNTHKTGHLLYMMYLVGDEVDRTRVERAIDYMVRHWSSPNSGTVGTHGWRGAPPSTLPSYIATVTLMKGLVAFELEEIGEEIDWFDDVSDVIVNNQRADGSWIQGGYPPGASHAISATTFALLTLLRATPLAPVDAAFENISYTTADYLVTSGLAGTGYYIVVPRNATEPTEEQIRAGADYADVTLAASGSGPVEEDVEATFALSGLEAGTAYDLYFVVQAPDDSYGLLVKSPFQTLAYTVPTVTETYEASEIEANSASSGGVVSQSGGLPVTQRGVVWSTSPGPTLDDHTGGGFTTDGDGLGAFDSLLTGLSPDTLYFVRAYALNAVGAGYAPGITISTPERAIPLLGLTTLQYGWYARFSEWRIRGRFVFDEPLQPEDGPLQMRRIWLDTPDENTHELFHYTNQTVFGTNVIYQQGGWFPDDIPSDGEYTLHVEFADQTVTQTVFQFFIPGTTNPLPTVAQNPNIINPPRSTSIYTTEVEFVWGPVTDTNATFINLVCAGQFWTLPRETTAYGPVEIPHGPQAVEVWFMHGYDGLYTEEGIPYQIGKGRSRVMTFTMVNDTEYTLSYATGPGGSLEGNPLQVVLFGGDGDTVEAIPEPGALFGGWSDELGGNPRTDIYVTNDITATAWFISPAGVPIQWYIDNDIAPGPGETWADVDDNDQDGDGASNADEFFADTDPNDPDDALRIDAFTATPEVAVEFISSTNRLYLLRFSYDLESESWFDLPGAEPRPGVGGPDVLHDPYAPPYPHYYRIESLTP